MPWRKRLGASEKAPIDKLQDAAVSKLFGFISGTVCGIIGFFAPKMLAAFINFLSENTGGQASISTGSDEMMYAQIGCAGIGFFVMFLRS
ncbi:MAG: hypothetical protein RL095_1005 [Verrucomicrobiota bacterium]|jgi:hypothetical protein